VEDKGVKLGQEYSRRTGWDDKGIELGHE